MDAQRANDHSMTWIKICGTTNLEDAHVAVEAGADAIGFVFGPSKRQVTPEKAARIAAQLPAGIERVGVFVNESPTQVRTTVEQVGLTVVQLQGDEDLNYVRELFPVPEAAERSTRPSIFKTLSFGPELEHLLHDFGPQSGVDAILFDSGNVQERGGTGRTFPWKPVASMISARQMRIIVAGGLNASNVAEAISILHPWGVDVVSGTESVPGKKDPEKIRAFIAAVRQADGKG